MSCKEWQELLFCHGLQWVVISLSKEMLAAKWCTYSFPAPNIIAHSLSCDSWTLTLLIVEALWKILAMGKFMAKFNKLLFICCGCGLDLTKLGYHNSCSNIIHLLSSNQLSLIYGWLIYILEIGERGIGEDLPSLFHQ